MRRFAGVFLREQIKDARGRYGVINLDDTNAHGSAANGGTHWVAWYDNSYFDSYGSGPPDELLNARKITQYSSTVNQAVDDINCGYWAILFLKTMARLKGDFPATIVELEGATNEQLYNAAMPEALPLVGGAAPVIKNKLLKELNQLKSKIYKGDLGDVLAQAYLGDEKEGTAQAITSLVGDVVSAAADRFLPGSGEVVNFAFGGLANAIQNLINQEDYAKAQRKFSELKAKVTRTVNEKMPGLSDANKEKAKLILLRMFSDMSADVDDLSKRLKIVLAGGDDPGSPEEQEKMKKIKVFEAETSDCDKLHVEAWRKDPPPRDLWRNQAAYTNWLHEWNKRHPEIAECRAKQKK